MSDDMQEFLLLQLRNAITDKEWVIACANKETASGGWTCDWSKGIREADAAVQDFVNAVRNRMQL